MAQLSRISEHVQLQSSTDKFFEFLKNKTEHFTSLFPQIVESYEMVEGNGLTHGSISRWKYDFGMKMQATIRLLIDEPNRSVTYEYLEGDVLKDFKEFKVTIQAIDGGNNGASSVKWSSEFVKANEDVPPPHIYLKYGIKFCKGIDTYLCKN